MFINVFRLYCSTKSKTKKESMFSILIYSSGHLVYCTVFLDWPDIVQIKVYYLRETDPKCSWDNLTVQASVYHSVDSQDAIAI